MNDTDALLGPWLQRFLTHHLVTERNLSRNTCKAYRDTFKLLVPFACAQLGKQDYQLTVPDLSSELVRRFLGHIEDERGCCAHTRNQRLTTIRAFAGFVASHDPAHVAWRGQISGIASKKTTSKPVPWLTVDEMHALLDVPEPGQAFPIRVQTRADLEAARFDLLAWQDPRGGGGPASPFWVQDGMVEAVVAPGAEPLAELVAAGGGAVEGLRLLDGGLVLKIEHDGRAVQVLLRDAGPFPPGAGIELRHPFGLRLPQGMRRLLDFWQVAGRPPPPR